MITLICQCCHKSYNAESITKWTLCPPCTERWEQEARWEASEEAWREQENEMLRARGFIIEDYDEDNIDFLDIEDDEYCDWLCEICGDPVYDCGHDVCGHCGDALSDEQIGVNETCTNCGYELEHPQDEIEYDMHNPF